MTRAWLGDWYARIRERVGAHGYATATAFAEAHPTESLLILAEMLGPEDVAAEQLERVLIDEANEARTLKRCARSLLVRNIRDELPEGWQAQWDYSELGPHSRRASAFAAWATSLGEHYDENTERVWNTIIELPIPAGWLPDGPDDPYIVKAFEHWQDPV